ncbi:hypothetical protein NEF87_000468 [Candidatus Lokiarchaeum ossiferum]|uniref:HTH arsR-type domain-containing protein n=1 Tax=Candidatus Lokiarchaeum ossiferum TaxID=2951803 RepID=A0ABY6HKZ9_9ARCH|nr:hypothetical protein NEF87_000468 [Candidatus Lokiarchaeum sp. B-35]
MKNTDLRKAFKLSYKEGKDGKFENYMSWLENQGFPNYLLNYNLTKKYLFHNLEYLALDLDLIAKLGKSVGYFINNQDDPIHISLVGVKGSGKTLYLNTILSLIKEIEDNLKVNYIDWQNVDNPEKLDEILNDSQLYNILLFDSCEKRKDFFNIFSSKENYFKNKLIISSWAVDTFFYNNDEILNLFPNINTYYINSLTEKNAESLLDILVQEFKGDKQDILSFNSFFFKYSGGNPEMYIRLFIKSVKKQFLLNLDEFTLESINFARDEMNLSLITELEKLSNQHKNFLKEILILSRNQKVYASKLIEKFNLTKATVSYHLSQLKEKKFVIYHPEGRSIFYTINPNLEPYIQIFFRTEAKLNDKTRNLQNL